MVVPVSVSSLPAAFVLISETAPLRSIREILNHKVSLARRAVEPTESDVLQAFRG